MIFLGTAAAALVPNPFCECETCRNTRKVQGLTRMRSTFLVDKEVLIDMGPDLCAASVRFDAPLSDLQHILVTHTHGDHFCTESVNIISMAHKREKPLNIYVSNGGMEFLKHLGTWFHSRIHPIAVTPYQPLQVGSWDVFPVESNHVDNGFNHALTLNYWMKKDGVSLLYASDCGLYDQKNLDALKGANLDYLVMEATDNFDPEPCSPQHLNFRDFYIQLDRFLEYGIIREDTKIYATHLGQDHKHGGKFQEYFDSVGRYNVTAAKDGMEI
jgi:phosphoribosyl 1,2-cyclic phosphate phosphodiesterase